MVTLGGRGTVLFIQQLDLQEGDFIADIFSASLTSSLVLNYGVVEFVRKVDLLKRYPLARAELPIGQAQAQNNE